MGENAYHASGWPALYENWDIRDFLASYIRQSPEQAEQNRIWSQMQALRLSIPDVVMGAVDAARVHHGSLSRWAAGRIVNQILKEHHKEMSNKARAQWKRSRILESASTGYLIGDNGK